MTKKIPLLFLLLCAPTSFEAKVLLWDLGGVLCEPNKLGVGVEIGLGFFARHAFWDLSSPTTIQKTLFDILSILEKPLPENKGVAGSHSGMSLPTVMCRWQAGTITGKQIIKKAIPLVKKLYTYDYFESKEHAELIIRCLKKMFDPAVLARNVYTVPAGFQLVRECRKQRNEDGTKKHRQFIFSNWDPISFNIFRKEKSHYFQYFEEIIISGHIQRIKPHKETYEYIIEKYALTPSECILIDDQESNVRAARQAGMRAILVNTSGYENLRKKLVQFGVLE